MDTRWLWVVALLAAACGGTASVEGGGGSGAAGAGGEGGAASICPLSPPAYGSACTLSGGSGGFRVADCSWGDDPRPQCRTMATCAQGAWSVEPPSEACATPPLPAACPSTAPSMGETCADSTLGCWYGDGERCWCSACQGGSEYPICQPIDPPAWACASPLEGCPTVIPQAGTACSTPGLECGPDCTLPVVCENGYWAWQQSNCPICAAPDTPIATPDGERPIASLRPGDLVYSEDRGAVVAVPILRVGSTPVLHHQVIRVALENGRTLEVSAGHPTADGRRFGELRAGSALDAANRVASASLVPYKHARTYDILPASSTGTYFAAGAEIGSTLFEASASGCQRDMTAAP